MSENIKRGIFFAFITSLISGVSIFYNKLVLTQGMDPLILNIIKNGGVAFIFSLLILAKPQRQIIAKLPISGWLKLFIIGIIGGSLPFILYFEGLRLISPTNANLIHKTMFLWVAAIAIPFLGERLNSLQIIGYLLVVVSNFFIGGFTGFTWDRGEMLIFLATILWSLENIIIKITLKDINYKIMAWGRMFLGSLILISVALIQNKLILFLSLPFSTLLLIAGSILLLSLYVINWLKALQKAPVTLITSVLILATPITNILTAIFITHSLSQFPLINTLLTSIGILLITLTYLLSAKTNIERLPIGK